MDVIVGIDLGTTNSEVTFLRDGQPEVVRDERGDPMLPSFVGLAADGRLLVGHPARNQWMLAPERTVKSIKRRMGEDVRVRLGEREYAPQEISAMILQALRLRVSQRLGVAVRKAVITVPAYFTDAQRRATREAGEIAGFEVMRILNEPTAASLCYDPRQRGLSRVLIYDLGGGTFDVSIAQVEDGVVEILASRGDTHLGGDDLDQALAGVILERFAREQHVDLHGDAVACARVLRAAEEAKKRLSVEPFARVQEEFIAAASGRAHHLDLEIRREDLEEIARPFLDRTISCVGQALEDAGLTPIELDRVVLAGGSTRMPMVCRMLEERLARPVHAEVDPDLCVALGAALQAGMLAGAEVGPVLVDITPHSLGIRCLGEFNDRMITNMFSPILPRGTALPATRTELYRTVNDGQPQVCVEVFQGEHPIAHHNTAVGNFVVDGLAGVPAGNEVTVAMELSLDGILHVTATEKRTGLRQQVRMEGPVARFDGRARDEARARVEDLFAYDPWVDSGEDLDRDGSGGEGGVRWSWSDEAGGNLPHRGGEREPGNDHCAVPGGESPLPLVILDAGMLLGRAERLAPHASPENRAEIVACAGVLKDAVVRCDLDAIRGGCEELAELLFHADQVAAEVGIG